MDIHKNARLTPILREELAQTVLQQAVTLKAAAAAFNVSARTAAKWVRRYQHEGRAGMGDRSSRPHHSPRRTPHERIQHIHTLRRLRWTGCRIAQVTGLSRATICRILRALHLHRLRCLEPARVYPRYEWPTPGDLLHLDIKKLARFCTIGHRFLPRSGSGSALGWEFLHVAIDDHSRIAFAQLHPDATHHSARTFLQAALAFYAGLGIEVRRLMTDNGSCYVAAAFRQTLRQLQLRHILTRPYTPRTNGKAERFIQTALREWVYARAYPDSDRRAAHLAPWLHQYNCHRPHASLNAAPPISRSGLDRNNLLRHDT